MQVTITGKQLDVGEALREHVEANLAEQVAKYFDHALESAVVFSSSAKGRLIRADITVHAGRNIQMQGRSEAADAYAAFDAALDRIAKRLRRYKRRLRDHRKGASDEALPALKSIISDSGDEETEVAADAQPVVIAEMTTPVETMTVGEAVMQMDMVDTSALMFRNSAHGGLNVVYRRRDGNIGWIDPQGNPSA